MRTGHSSLPGIPCGRRTGLVRLLVPGVYWLSPDSAAHWTVE